MKRSLCAVAILLLAGCNNWGDGPPVFGTREYAVSGSLAPVKQVGEACRHTGDYSNGAENDCLTGFCMHTGSADPNQGWFCTRPCVGDFHCPRDFRCSQWAPDHYACIPPDGWSGGIATGVNEP